MGLKRFLDIFLLLELAVGATLCGILFYLSVISFLHPALSLIYVIIFIWLYCLGTHYYDFIERKKK